MAHARIASPLRSTSPHALTFGQAPQYGRKLELRQRSDSSMAQPSWAFRFRSKNRLAPRAPSAGNADAVPEAIAVWPTVLGAWQTLADPGSHPSFEQLDLKPEVLRCVLIMLQNCRMVASTTTCTHDAMCTRMGAVGEQPIENSACVPPFATGRSGTCFWCVPCSRAHPRQLRHSLCSLR